MGTLLISNRSSFVNEFRSIIFEQGQFASSCTNQSTRNESATGPFNSEADVGASLPCSGKSTAVQQGSIPLSRLKRCNA